MSGINGADINGQQARADGSDARSRNGGRERSGGGRDEKLGTAGTAGSTIAAGGKVGWWSRTVSAGGGTIAGGTIDARGEGKWQDIGLGGAKNHGEEETGARIKENVVEGQFRAAGSLVHERRQQRQSQIKKRMSDYSQEPFKMVNKEEAVKDNIELKRGSIESYTRPTQMFQESKRQLGQGLRNNTMNFYEQLKGATKANGDDGVARDDIEKDLNDHQPVNRGQHFNRTQETQLHQQTLYPNARTTSNLSNTQFDVLGGVSKLQPQDSQVSQARLSQEMMHTPPDLLQLVQESSQSDYGLARMPTTKFKQTINGSQERQAESSAVKQPNRQVDGPKIISRSLQRVPKDLKGSTWVEDNEENHGRKSTVAAGVINATTHKRSKLAQSQDLQLSNRSRKVDDPNNLKEIGIKQSATNQVLTKNKQSISHFEQLTFKIKNAPEPIQGQSQKPIDIKPVKNHFGKSTQNKIAVPMRKLNSKKMRPEPLKNPKGGDFLKIGKDNSSSVISSVLSEQNLANSSNHVPEKAQGQLEPQASSSSYKLNQQVKPISKERKVVPALNLNLASNHKSKEYQAKPSNFDELTDRGQKRAADLIKSLKQTQRQRNLNDSSIANASTHFQQQSIDESKQPSTVNGIKTVGGFASRLQKLNGNNDGQSGDVQQSQMPPNTNLKVVDPESVSDAQLRKAVQFSNYNHQFKYGGASTNSRDRPELKFPLPHATTRSFQTESEKPSTHRPFDHPHRGNKNPLGNPKTPSKVMPPIAMVDEQSQSQNDYSDYKKQYVQRVKSKSQAAIGKNIKKSAATHRQKASLLQIIPNASNNKIASHQQSDKSDHSYEFQNLESATSMVKDKLRHSDQLNNIHSLKLEKEPEKEMEFDDAVEKFVDIIRLTTQVSEINIYTSQLIQIYHDVPGAKEVALSPQQRASLQQKLEKFGNEVVERAKKMKEGKDIGPATAGSGDSKAGNTQTQDLRSNQIKRAQYASRYKLLDTSHWKKYTAEEDVTPWELLQGDKMKRANEFVSDLPGFHIFLAKIAFSVDKKDFEDYQQYSSRRSLLENQVNNDEEYLVFCCLFSHQAPEYHAEMFMNMCQNFLIADEELRNELETLINITKQVAPNQVTNSIDSTLKPPLISNFQKISDYNPPSQDIQAFSEYRDDVQGQSLNQLQNRNGLHAQARRKPNIQNAKPKTLESSQTFQDTQQKYQTSQSNQLNYVDDEDAVNDEFSVAQTRPQIEQVDQAHILDNPAIITNQAKNKELITIQNQEITQKRPNPMQAQFSPSRSGGVPTIRLNLPKRISTLSQEELITTPKQTNILSTPSQQMKSEPRVIDDEVEHQSVSKIDKNNLSKGRRQWSKQKSNLQSAHQLQVMSNGKNTIWQSKGKEYGKRPTSKITTLRSQRKIGIDNNRGRTEKKAQGRGTALVIRDDKKLKILRGNDLRRSADSANGSIGSMGRDGTSTHSLGHDFMHSPQIATLPTGLNLRTDGTSHNLRQSQQPSSTVLSNFEDQKTLSQKIKQKYGKNQMDQQKFRQSLDVYDVGAISAVSSQQKLKDSAKNPYRQTKTSSIFHQKSLSQSTNSGLRQLNNGSPKKVADGTRQTPLSRQYFQKVNRRYENSASGSKQNSIGRPAAQGQQPTQQPQNSHRKNASKSTATAQKNQNQPQNLGPQKLKPMNTDLSLSSSNQQFISNTRGSKDGLIGHELSFQGSLNSVKANQMATQKQKDISKEANRFVSAAASGLIPSVIPQSNLTSPTPSTHHPVSTASTSNLKVPQPTINVVSQPKFQRMQPQHQILQGQAPYKQTSDSSLSKYGGYGNIHSDFDFSFGDNRSHGNRFVASNNKEQSKFVIQSGQSSSQYHDK